MKNSYPWNRRADLILRCLTGVLGLLLAVPAFAQAQYEILSWTVAGGGGSSSGGDYALHGTLGQTEAGTNMSGGDYALSGGFWFSVSVEPSPPPKLTITSDTGGQLALSWSPVSPGWILQENSSLSPTGWVDTAAATSSPVMVPVAEATKFYRLKRAP